MIGKEKKWNIECKEKEIMAKVILTIYINNNNIIVVLIIDHSYVHLMKFHDVLYYADFQGNNTLTDSYMSKERKKQQQQLFFGVRM